MKNLRLGIILFFAEALLLIPLIAMQFNSGVDWDSRDFLIMGILLLITGAGTEFALRKFSGTMKRLLAVGVVLLIFFLIWAELAVGIFGTPFAGS